MPPAVAVTVQIPPPTKLSVVPVIEQTFPFGVLKVTAVLAVAERVTDATLLSWAGSFANVKVCGCSVLEPVTIKA